MFPQKKTAIEVAVFVDSSATPGSNPLNRPRREIEEPVKESAAAIHGANASIITHEAPPCHRLRMRLLRRSRGASHEGARAGRQRDARGGGDARGVRPRGSGGEAPLPLEDRRAGGLLHPL